MLGLGGGGGTGGNENDGGVQQLEGGAVEAEPIIAGGN